MLGRDWRLRGSNTQNQAITLTVKARFFKFGSNGAVEWSTEQTLINAASVSATTGTTVSGTVNNNDDKWVGMEITASLQAASATNGNGSMLLTLENSTDGGTTWPAQDLGLPIGQHTLVAADGTAARLRNFVVED
jgi:hypothetical protein